MSPWHKSPLAPSKGVVTCNFYPEAISFTSVASDLLVQCRKSLVRHLLFHKMKVPHNTPGHLHSIMRGAEKDEPSGTEGAGGNCSAREQIRVRKMQIVNKDGSVLRLAKWLLLSHSNPGLSPLRFTCHSGMQYKNACRFTMFLACTGCLTKLLQTIKVVPCTNCPVC